MPHLPDRHTDHDVALVAASISDDLTAAERATVTDLLAACAECRELAADLRTLAAATAALPVPPRRRDYRLTAEQAARLRPSGLRGLVAALGSRRFSFAAPLGTAMATLGIVGLLVAAIPGPLAGGAAQAPMPEIAAPEMAAPAPAASVPAAAPGEGGFGAAGDDGGAAGAGGTELTEPLTTTASDAPPAGGGGSTEDAQGSERDATGTATDDGARSASPAGIGSGRDTTLLTASSIAVVAGLVLMLLRWAGRRIAPEA